MFSAKDNPANIRGDIQAGLTGDKKPGFDPAAAPLETDSEAGGAPLEPEHVRMARGSQADPVASDWQGSHAEAMRDFEPKRESARSGLPRTGLLIAAGIFVVIGIVWLALV